MRQDYDRVAGSSYVLLEVDVPGVIKGRLDRLSADVGDTFRRERIGYDLSTTIDTLNVHIPDSAQFDTARKILRDIAEPPPVSLVAGREVHLEQGPHEWDFSDDGRGNYVLKMSEAYRREGEGQIIVQMVDAVRQRLEQLELRDLTVQRENDNRIQVGVSGAKNAQEIVHYLDSTRMTFRLVDSSAKLEDALAGRIPADDELLWKVDGAGKNTLPLLVERHVLLSGAHVVSAGYGERESVVSIELDRPGAGALADVTKENVNRALAIVLDGKVIATPVIREPFSGYVFYISGNFTAEASRNFATWLNSATKLPFDFAVVEQR